MRVTDFKKIKVSVAVVFYNPTKVDVMQTLGNIQKLDSIEQISFSFYLIDNASTGKGLFNFIPKRLNHNIYCKKLNENKGFGSGHNSVLNDLTSDFHIIMNPDVELKDLTGVIEAISYMKGHNNVGLLSPLVRNKDNGEIQYLNRKLPTVFDLFIRFLGPNVFKKRQEKFVKKEHGYDHIQEEENATGSFMIVRTSAFIELNGFDERFFMYFEDTDLTRRISKNYQVVFSPLLTVKHVWRRENHSLKGFVPMIKSMVLYFNKWGWDIV